MSEYFHNPNTKSDRTPNVAPLGAKNVGPIVIKRYSVAHDVGNTRTFAKRGGMCGAPTSNNGLRCVPKAFMR